MPWYSKNAGNGVAALGPPRRMTEAFVALARDHAVSADAAIFSRHDVAANVVTLYFSPTADVIATALGATPCERPNADLDLTLLVGDFNSWAIHFPEHNPGKLDCTPPVHARRPKR